MKRARFLTMRRPGGCLGSLFTGLWLLASSCPILAQTLPATPEGEPVVVSAANPDAETVVPGSKLLPSALGLDLPVLDTPRGVTVLSRRQLEDTNIQDSEGTGLGSPNDAPFQTRTYRQPDIPRHAFSSRLSYQLDAGLGASLGAVVTSPQNLTFNGSVKIPTQYSIDASIYYVKPRYEVRLDFYNITDRHNWSPVADFDGADSVFAELPFHLEGTVRFKF